MASAGELRDYPSVRTWFQGLREQWGEDPDDVDLRLRVLEGFCRFVERDPDAIIRECVREFEGQKRISIKGRRFYDEKIREFQSSVAGDARTQAQWGNMLRSFLIHNGIFLQSGLQM